jgi:hypothetical protein
MFWSGTVLGAISEPPVDVFVASTPETMMLLRGAIGVGERPIRWLRVDRIDETQVLRRPDAHATGRARAWIDCSRSDRVRVYFANWDTERFLVRDIPLPNGWNEVARESLAQLIDSSITVLGTDETAGMSQTEMASVLGNPPTLPADGAPGWGFTWGAFYAVQAFAEEEPVEHGPGLAAALGPREGRWRPGAWISVQYQLPQSIGTDLIGVRLDTVALRAGARLTRVLTDRVALALQAGAGGDLVHITPQQGSTAHASLSADRFSWEFAAQVALAATVRPTAQLELWGALLADMDLGMRHYDVVVDGSRMRAFTPFWVRPGLLVGVTWP